MAFTAERLAHLAAQHRMDGGGYEWEACDESTPELAARQCVAWDDPDWDYLTGDRPEGVPAGTYGLSFVWAPVGDGVFSDDWAQLPDLVTLPSRPGMVMRAISHGVFYPRDTECDCAEIEDPHFECPYCEGSGYIDCDGGPWAVYATEPDPEYFAINVGPGGTAVAPNRPEFAHLIMGLGSDVDDAIASAVDQAIEAGLLCPEAAEHIAESYVGDDAPDPDVASICVLWLGRR